jgi:hypothetical protein
MSQVMMVNQLDGGFYCVDAEGKALPKNDSQFMSDNEARVLMNRIAEGYVELPYGYIAMHLMLNGVHPADYFEFVTIVHHQHVPHPGEMFGGTPDLQLVRVDLIEAEEYNDWQVVMGKLNNYSRRIAKVDYEAQTVVWVENPLLDDPYTPEYLKGTQVVGASSQCEMLVTAMRYLSAEQPMHVSMIEVVTRN